MCQTSNALVFCGPSLCRNVNLPCDTVTYLGIQTIRCPDLTCPVLHADSPFNVQNRFAF